MANALFGFIALDPAFTPDDWITMYAVTQFHAPQAQEAELQIGSDDAIKLWLNGELVHQNNVYRAAKPGDDVARVHLRKGTNTLLIKLMEGILGCGFYVQFATRDGTEIKGLRPIAHDAIYRSLTSEVTFGHDPSASGRADTRRAPGAVTSPQGFVHHCM